MTKIFDYDVTYMRVETHSGYIEADSVEDASRKMKEAAEKQNLIGFKIKSIKPSDIVIPDYDTFGNSESEEDSADTDNVVQLKTPPKSLN